MPVKFTNVQDAIADNGIKILVHGPAGTGKTVLSATTNAKTLLINAEAGLLSLKNAVDDPRITTVNDISHITVATITNIQDLYEVYDSLVANPGDFEWVNLDSISEIAEVVLSYEKAQTKDPRKAYGELQEQLTSLLRAFRDLPNYNVCMTCKQQMTKDEYSGITMYGPALPGTKLPQQVAYLFDEVFAMRAERNEQGELVRSLQTERDMQYEAKDRSGKLAMYEIPSLQVIHDKIRGVTPEVPEVPEEEGNQE